MKNTRKIFFYLPSLMKSYYITFVLLIGFVVCSKIFTLIPPFINGKIIDQVLSRAFHWIVYLLLFSFVSYLLSHMFSFIQTWLKLYLENHITMDLRAKLYEKILILKIRHFEEQGIGEYLSKLEGDTNAIVSFYITTIPTLMMSFVTMMITGAFSFYLSPGLSLIGTISFPFSLWIYHIFGNKVKTSYEKVRNVTDDYTGFTQDVLQAERTIKSLHIEQHILFAFRENLKNLRNQTIRSGMVSAFGGLTQAFSATIFELFLIGIASYLIIQGKLTIGYYVAFNVYLSQFISSLRTIASTHLNVQTVFVSMDRLDTILKHTNCEELSSIPYHANLYGDINIYNLSFSYHQDRKVLDGFSARFYANEVTAIVGTSGCGKSTLLGMLIKFYERTEGSILFGKHAIDEIPLHNLRTAVSYVEQNPYIFKGTIKSNLNIVSPEATEDEIWGACRQAYLYDTIMALPEGLNTIIGDGGHNLSGGQKQRLAIARGLLKKSRFFLLDEITSDLDGEAEKYIIKVMFELAKNCTVILVAHRSTTIMHIPRILVMDRGKCIAEGSHALLMDTCEKYQTLFSDYEEELS